LNPENYSFALQEAVDLALVVSSQKKKQKIQPYQHDASGPSRGVRFEVDANQDSSTVFEVTTYPMSVSDISMSSNLT